MGTYHVLVLGMHEQGVTGMHDLFIANPLPWHKATSLCAPFKFAQ